MADQTQTEKDTAKARSRTTRSGEFQRRVDAAEKAKASAKSGATQKATQPTAEQTRKAKLDKNRTKDTQRDTDRANSRVTRSREYQRRIDAMAEAEQVGTPQGNVDFTSSTTTASSGGSAGLSGINIVWADQTESFILATDILEDYDGEDYWSVVFGVSTGAFTKAITFDATQELWDDVGALQTVYRLRVKTLNGDGDPTQISAYGQYREDFLCVSGDPVVTLLNIS